MKNKTIFWLVLGAIVLFVVYSQAQKNPPPASSVPGAPPAGTPRTLLQSINDLSYNLLFGWWLK